MKPHIALWNYDTEQYDIFDMQERPSDMEPYVSPHHRPLYHWLLNSGQNAWGAAYLTLRILEGDWESYGHIFNHKLLFVNIWKALLSRYQTHQEGGHGAGFASCTHPNCREAHLLESMLEGAADDVDH